MVEYHLLCRDWSLSVMLCENHVKQIQSIHEEVYRKKIPMCKQNRIHAMTRTFIIRPHIIGGANREDPGQIVQTCQGTRSFQMSRFLQTH